MIVRTKESAIPPYKVQLCCNKSTVCLIRYSYDVLESTVDIMIEIEYSHFETCLAVSQCRARYNQLYVCLPLKDFNCPNFP